MNNQEARERILDTIKSYEQDMMIAAEAVIFSTWLVDNDLCLDFIEWSCERDYNEDLRTSFESFKKHWYRKQLEVSE